MIVVLIEVQSKFSFNWLVIITHYIYHVEKSIEVLTNMFLFGRLFKKNVPLEGSILGEDAPKTLKELEKLLSSGNWDSSLDYTKKHNLVNEEELVKLAKHYQSKPLVLFVGNERHKDNPVDLFVYLCVNDCVEELGELLKEHDIDDKQLLDDALDYALVTKNHEMVDLLIGLGKINLSKHIQRQASDHAIVNMNVLLFNPVFATKYSGSPLGNRAVKRRFDTNKHHIVGNPSNSDELLFVTMFHDIHYPHASRFIKSVKKNWTKGRMKSVNERYVHPLWAKRHY